MIVSILIRKHFIGFMLALILYFMGVSRINNFYLVLSHWAVFLFCRFRSFFLRFFEQRKMHFAQLAWNLLHQIRDFTPALAFFFFISCFVLYVFKYIYSKLHFVWTRCRHFSSLDFDFFFERVMLRREIYAIKKIDTWCFDVFHY